VTGSALELARREDRHGPADRVELLLPDSTAILRGKWVPGATARRLADTPAGMPVSAHAPDIHGHTVAGTGMGMVNGDPDAALIPGCGPAEVRALGRRSCGAGALRNDRDGSDDQPAVRS